MSRGEFAAFIVRATDLSAETLKIFEDAQESVFKTDIGILAARGVSKGCNPPANSRFCPGRPINRGEVAALLVRALDLPTTSTDYFSDDNSSIFESAINALAHAGITQGCASGRYCPDRQLPRDEMASFLARALKGGGSPPPVAPPADPPGSGDWITVSPGENLQEAINANPAGSQFFLEPGTHRLVSVVPKNGNTFAGASGTIVSGARQLSSFEQRSGVWVAGGQTQKAPESGKCESGSACRLAEGVWIDGQELGQVTDHAQLKPGTFFFDYGANEIHLADDPSGKLVETSVSQHAFEGGADDVSIRDIIIEKYANPAQTGVIQPALHANLGHRWIVDGVEVRYSHGAGLKLGWDMVVSGSHFHHNGWMGVHGSSKVAGASVIDTEIASNCVNGFQCFGWGGGGLKVSDVHGLVVEGSEIHHNLGKGLHADNESTAIRFVANSVHDNDGVGILAEVSSEIEIEGNAIDRNGHNQTNGAPGAGVAVLAASNVEIWGNSLSGNGHGVILRQTNRDYRLDHVRVADNQISMSSGVTGVYSDDGSDVYSRDISFVSNDYDLGSGKKYYYWAGAQRTAAEWRAYGNDTAGTWG